MEFSPIPLPQTLLILGVFIDSLSTVQANQNCTSLSCQHGGRCVESNSTGFKCVCTAGYYGQRCEIAINECESNPCKNGGTCIDGLNKFMCICTSGFTGPVCQHVDQCYTKPCLNNGKCSTDAFGNFRCHCPSGWKGKICNIDIDECSSSSRSPCDHGGTCVNTPGNFQCQCIAGYAGERCDMIINECRSNPCKNSAICLDLLNKFQCLCNPGWTGVVCDQDINECQSTPCQNDGQCHDFLNGYNCTCQPGFIGANCETNYDDCKSNPCQNGATCVDLANGFRCVCPVGTSGELCERGKGRCGDPPSIPNGYISVKRKSLVLYNCNKGYGVIGIRFLKCSKGKWIGRPPTCQRRAKPRPSCGKPPGIRHGQFQPDRDRFAVGTTVKYTCKGRYRLIGDAKVTCGKEGTWKSQSRARCIRKVKCPDPGTPKHGQRIGSLFYEGTQVRFYCEGGYDLIGSRALECVRLCLSCVSVRWNGTTPTCVKIDPLRGLQRVAENLRRHFIDKLSWSTSDSFARSGLSSGAEGLDLVFVFDSSASVGQTNFNKGIAFAKTIIDEFGISSSPSGTRVAVVTFSSTARIVFNLQTGAMPSKNRAIQVLENLDFIAGGTATSIALNMTIEKIVPETRNNSKKALFLITDGRSNTGGDPIADALILRESCDFEIYAIGVTNSVDEQELRGIASEPFRTHVFLLANFEDLTKLRQLITAKGTDYTDCGVAGDTQLRNDERTNSRIVGKSEAKPGAWPWIAAVYVRSKFRCGGVLIKGDWVLTLARCFLNDANLKPKDVVIRLGEHDRFTEEGTEQNRRAKKLFIYPNTNMARLKDDLALVSLMEAVKFSPFVRTVCLPQSSDIFYVRTGKLSLIAGWGSSQEVPSDDVAGAPLQVLQQTQIEFASQRGCRENATDPAAITDRVVCAGNSNGDKNACKGDRGSPLVIRRSDNRDSWALVGLASWSDGCATQGKYGVYTRVDKYMRWINRKMNKKKKKKKD